MIGYLQGKLIAKHPPELLIDVHGVGYEVYASMNTFYQLPEVGQNVSLHTQLIVREDAQILYGFYDKRERALFRELIKVNSIGPKIALAILSSIDPDGFVCCITNNHASTLRCIPGIGPKTAERLVMEMKDKLKSLYQNVGDLSLKSSLKINPSDQKTQDAINALVALGYKLQEATQAVSKIAQSDLNSEALIRLALKEMVRK